MGEPTADELRDICSSFMLSAPPGEFLEVVTDIRGLLKDESILNSSAPATFRQYNQEQLTQVDGGKGHKVLITAEGEVGDGKYLDPKGGQVIKYDHIKGAVTGSEPIGAHLDKGIEEMRKAVETAAFAYVGNHYPDGATTVYGKGKTVTVCIQSSKYNPGNFWNGRWRSTWACTVDGSNVTVKGVIRVQVHYFEDGNVQLNTETKKSFTVPQGKPAETGEAILSEIKKAESGFGKSLDVQFSSLGDTTFKALRRALPITRSKVDWSKISQYKISLSK